jgi:pimeloyl-ACP methyl ester carboxylesterase
MTIRPLSALKGDIALPASIDAPPWTLLGIEPLRAAMEYASMKLMHTDDLPQGDGHAVVIFPGLAADRSSVAPLKNFCQRLGYDADDWGRGLNTGPSGDVDAWLAELAQHVQEATQSSGERISLIGWSLGGIYAREIARLLPDEVRQVITIGTPFSGGGMATNAGWLYRLLNGQQPVIDEALAARLRSTPPVPTTSIYSRSDGVVAWQACREDARCAHAENVEVEGSHFGLVFNPAVLAVVANRLSQPDGAWRKHAAPARLAAVPRSTLLPARCA